MKRFVLGLWACGALVACSGKSQKIIDAAPGDALPVDGSAPVDAGVDANQFAPGREVTTGAGRMSGSTHVMDVQIGHGVPQTPQTGTAHRAEGNAPIKP